ncbi:catalase family peroxidase [Nocardia huaxiensis]|uniref:Catalase-related peroxidase n=1 Tax=Nocardia huaxiensis TaxID=2755382 RepID=A0A7D6Z371_9NOCA|nr:catalase family peroxidase [Nocardia huaxiensis]QLY31726.1 catalase family peroxidase [Nocardia huaxiensis]
MGGESIPLRPNRRTVLGAALAAGAGAMSVGGFLFAANAIGPARLTARRIVDGLQAANGFVPGYRRNHAKGLAVAGRFDSTGAGAELSSATVFRPGSHPFSGRFSLAGGKPFAPDTPAARRGFGLRIDSAGEEWRLALLNIPVFTDASARDFHDRTAAYAPDPSTGKPDPARVRDYLAAHPKTAAALWIIEQNPPTASFATSTFHGLNAFECVDAHGRRTPVRWRLEPETTEATVTSGDDQLFTSLARDIRRAPVRWKLLAVVGIRGVDPTDDPTIAWPAERRRIDLGTLVVTDVATETAANVRDVNFDPLVLPTGLAASDDPVLQARSAAYAESFRRRAGETAARQPLRVEESA